MSDKPLTEPGEAPAADIRDEAGERPTREQLDALQRERDDYYDPLLPETAQFDKFPKRIERERREQSDQAVTDLLRELLLVVDDFDLALTVEPDEGESAYKKGVELIHAKLHDLLRKYGVRPIEALGADFDPNLHQAVI